MKKQNEFVKQVAQFQSVFDPSNIGWNKDRLERLSTRKAEDLLRLRSKLICEESCECQNAIARLIKMCDDCREERHQSTRVAYLTSAPFKERWRNAKREMADALGDILVVTIGTALTFGLDIEEIMRRIHTSNMSKLGEDGRPIYREDGKVLKGPNYEPPKLDDLI